MELDGLPQGAWPASSVRAAPDSAFVEEAMDLAHRALGVADVCVFALAAWVAGAFEAPCKADFLVAVLGDLDVLAFHHGGDGGVPSITEMHEPDGIGMSVEGGLGPSPLVRCGAESSLTLVVGGSVEQAAPVGWQQAE